LYGDRLDAGSIFLALSALFTLTVYVRSPLSPSGAALLARPHPLFDMCALGVKAALSVSFVWLALQPRFQWLLVALTVAGSLLLACVFFRFCFIHAVCHLTQYGLQ
jgi:hypothetical protein